MTCLAIRILLLQVAVAWASDDAECLLQVGMQVGQKRENHTQSPCACVPWTQAYSQGASCSTGNELFFVTQRRPTPIEATVIRQLMGSEACDNLFYHFTGSHNECVNMNPTFPDRGQWCYVSPQCNSLNGGTRGEPGQMSMKMCTSQDASLRSLTPRQIAQRAQDEHIDLATLHKMSYPVSAHLWEQVSGFWGVDGTPADLSFDLRKEMSEVVASGIPQSFVSSHPHPPHHIVYGHTAFAVLPNTASGLYEEVKTDNPATLSKLVCLTGCDLPTAQ